MMGGGVGIFRQSGFARLSAAFVAGVWLLLVVVLAGVYLIVGELLEARARQLLAADSASYAEVYTQRLLPGLREAVERMAGSPQSGRFVVLTGRDGEVLAGDRVSLPGGAETWTGQARFGAGGTIIAMARELRGGFRLVVGHDRSADQALLRQLGFVLGFIGLTVAAVGTLGGLILGRTALARVNDLDGLLRKVEAGELSARYPSQRRQDEFSAIGIALNRTLERLEASTSGLREVSDRVAHEMRTPLAHLRAGLDQLRRSAAPGERVALGELVAETDELIAVFSALLDIATTEAAASDPRGLTSVALDMVIDDVIELYDAVAEERQATLVFEARAGAEILGETPLIMRMIANIVDNAIKFSPVGGRVIITTRLTGETVELAIRDSGPGLDDTVGGKAFERFWRSPDAQDKPGHGLGLALVRAIAIRHGLKICLANVSPGLEVTIRGKRCPRES